MGKKSFLILNSVFNSQGLNNMANISTSATVKEILRGKIHSQDYPCNLIYGNRTIKIKEKCD